ncbi:hypothetical protein B0H11DRAFT_2231193 [Mycena galericulata]|nr:hypothetical protein B0H11DRAFT_2231193 [Mycena galericulata]
MTPTSTPGLVMHPVRIFLPVAWITSVSTLLDMQLTRRLAATLISRVMGGASLALPPTGRRALTPASTETLVVAFAALTGVGLQGPLFMEGLRCTRSSIAGALRSRRSLL